MNARSLLSVATAVLASGLVLGAPPAPAFAKGKAAPPPAKTGIYPLEFPPTYIQMAVPKEYDAAKWSPLLFFLHNSNETGEKPDAWVAAWAEAVMPKGWIVAGLHSPKYDNEESIEPIKNALAKVKDVYKIDDRRIVLCGHADL